MNYTPFYIKTENSLLESMIRIDDLITFALKNNLQTLTITDNNLYGALEFYNKCQMHNIKPIIGLELTLINKQIVLYAMNYDGYQNLLKLSTIMQETQLDCLQLKAYSENLICLLPYDALELYDELINNFKYIYKTYSNEEEKKQLNVSNIIYMKKILYLDASDSQYLPYLHAIKVGKSVDDIKITENYQLFLDTNDLENNQKIADLCNLEIKKHQDLLPIYECPNNLDTFTYLKQLCIEGLKKHFGNSVASIYQERLKYELSVINKMGFCNYFLVVWDYVKFAKNSGILVGPGRGSAAGSLVAYLLDITTIDPIVYNLIFERFLNPERITMPDIDIDFEYTRREEVINYCINKYGSKKVAPIITFGTLGAKQVLRDVGKTLDISLSDIDYFTKLFDSRLKLQDNVQNNPQIADYLKINEQFTKLFKIALKFEGLKRHTSIHAAGIVMSRNNLDEVIPLVKNHDNFYLTGYSMEYLEELGLLKMDFLALRNLTLIKDVLADISNLTFDSIPLNDKKALAIFTNVNTIGIFQFESQGMMNFLRKFRPNTFEDIFAALALFRPGPMANIDSYIRRKKGIDKIDYLDSSLENILKSTYGIIIYQEQIMQIASTLAGYSYGEADILRRAMSKKKEDVLLKEKDKFIKGSIAKGYTLDLATKVYDLILKFASYGFNRAHSVAYAMISYKMAYLKAYYPAFFIKNLLSMVIGSEGKTKEYIYEAKKNNISVLTPNINISTNDYIINNQNIVYPLTGIKNVGYMVVNTILEEREKRQFKDIFDFVIRCYGKSVNKKAILSLIYAGCFDIFGFNKKTLVNNLDAIINYSEIGELLSDEETLKPMITIEQEYDKKTLMEKELEVFGFYLGNNPIIDYKAKYDNIVDLNNIELFFDKIIETIVYVDHIKEITTKKNEKMVFITGSDEISSVDVVLFPRVYSKYNIKKGNILKLKAHVEKRYDKYQLVVNDLKILE